MSHHELLVDPVPALAQVPPYVLGRPESGIDIVLDFNESLASPASITDQTLPWPVNRYPDHAELERALARRLGVEADHVLATNGADDALERTVRSVCCAGRRAVVTTPSYGMIRRFAVLAGAEVEEIAWWRGDLPEQKVSAAAEGASLLALVSPNNPTGSVVSREVFTRIVTRLPESLILLDQAYLDFTASEYDLTSIALDHPNVVIVRTLSKAWGAAGLRVGYAVADPRVIDWLRRVGLPFPVSAPSASVALDAVVNGGPDQETIERIRRERETLTGLLEALGAEALPSQGSFILARFDDPGFVWSALAALGIAIRSFGGRSELDGWLRFTLPGDAAVFDRLCDALTTILKPEALLFDLDGVLADVSRSFREAIRKTAANFGVEVTPEQITRAKAEGNANNDWRLTHRLIQADGAEATLDEVTTAFEALYQGTDAEPGLRSTETLLVDRSTLERLARARPLGVVTGRPRIDAERFLSEHNIADLFTAVVTMEDAAAKPDPAPVRLALQHLGVRHAWLVGDTPDDIYAARAAGVLPIGVPAPGDDPASAAETLRHSGAGAILEKTESILEVLS